MAQKIIPHNHFEQNTERFVVMTDYTAPNGGCGTAFSYADDRDEVMAKAEEIATVFRENGIECVHHVWQRGNEVAHHKIMGRPVPFNVYVLETA